MNPTKHAVQAYPKTYDYVKEQEINDIPETYVPIAILNVPYREVGVYEYKMAITYNFSVANKSIFLRWRFNGGDWNEFISEPKDTTDDIPRVYFYPVEWLGGSLYAEVEARKEDALGTFDVHFMDIMWERKG